MKKYLGKNPLNTLMGIMLDVLPSKEIGDTDVTDMWSEINKDPIEVAPIGALDNWSYTIDDTNGTVTLNKYTGSETDVTVYGKYQLDGKVYDTDFANYTTGQFGQPVSVFCYTNIQTITFKKGINPKSFTDMRFFLGFTNLTQINGLENINLSKVTDMSCMFGSSKLLTSIDVSSFDTSKVTDMTQMFQNCESLTEIIGLENFDTSNVTNMADMFEGCSLLTELDLRSFNTSKVGDMRWMFKNCSALTEIKVTTGLWDTSNLASYGTTDMFTDCGVSSVTEYPAA